ncbi:MAG: helix-turn-helix transcriptional regulator [Deltaproteobacteria bacterium]|nr:helix-turn-helix transcriptional regulator [Deltaproteobacteria bacterium]
MARRETGAYDSKARRRLVVHIEKYWSTQKEFADAASITPQYLNHYLKGRQQPNLQHAVAIEIATETKGKRAAIRAREWLEPPS